MDKIAFTEEQIKFLKKCAEVAYVNRWNIGKDYFAALDEFMTAFPHFLKSDYESFEEYILYLRSEHGTTGF